MGIIKEEVKHPTLDIEIIIDEHSKDEVCREPWDIISLDVSFGALNKPSELIELGKWLIEQGARIQKEYTSKGKYRKISN